MKKFAVILSGCGVYDGSEIHEAVMTLWAITKNAGEYHCFAPDIEQFHVVDHSKGEPTAEKRNVLAESARIARGAILPLSQFNPENFDAIILPGGFGAAKNLSTWAFDGPECKVDPETENAVKGMFTLKKPIGALCIAPAVIAKILGNVEVTIGSDASTAAAIAKTGATHRISTHGEVVSDMKNKVFTTPCYMLDANIVQIGEGADMLVKTMMEAMG